MEVPLMYGGYDINIIGNFLNQNLDELNQDELNFFFNIVNLDNTDDKQFLETESKYGEVRQQINDFITTGDNVMVFIKSYLRELTRDQIILSDNQFVCQRLVNDKVLEYIRVNIGDLRNLRIYDVPAQGDCGFSVFALKLLFEGKLNELSYLYDPNKHGFDNYNLESKIDTFKSSTNFCELKNRNFPDILIKMMRNILDYTADINDWLENTNFIKFTERFNLGLSAIYTEGTINTNTPIEVITFALQEINISKSKFYIFFLKNHWLLIDDVKYEQVYNKYIPFIDETYPNINFNQLNLETKILSCNTD